MSKTVNFPLPISGVDMLSDETSLGKGTYRSAYNVDIARSGHFGRRKGFTKRVNGRGFHSMFGAKGRDITLVAQNTNLFVFNTTTLALTQLTTINSPEQLTYCEYNGGLYWANYSTLGWLPPDGSAPRAVGVPLIPTLPALSAGNGGLNAGRYGVAFTMVDGRGEEGGMSPILFVDLPAPGGISMSGLPVISGMNIRAYVTSTDGEQLRLAAQFPAAFSTYAIGEDSAGAAPTTDGLTQLPPGDFICALAGRLYTARDNVLSFSEPLRPHLHNKAHGFVVFAGPIRFIEAVTDGVYIADDRGVWFMDGVDPVKATIRLVSQHVPVIRSSVIVPSETLPDKLVQSKNPVALWLSSAGYVVGQENGVVVELQPDRVRVPPGLTGRTVLLLREGRKQVLTPVNSTSTAVLGTAVDSVIP